MTASVDTSPKNKSNASDTAQQGFCRDALTNVQNLIARMDVKAGIVLTVVSILSAAIYAIAGKLLDDGALTFWFRRALLGILLVYFVVVAYTLWEAMRVFLARPPRIGNYSQAPLMLYPLLILQSFKSDKEYAERAVQLSDRDIVADYSNQVMECSNIYRVKHAHVGKAIVGLSTLLVPWLLFLVAATSNLFVDFGSGTVSRIDQVVGKGDATKK